MKNINIKELALKLNLSVSTVSKSLNDSYEISEETKRRVLEMAELLNYVPNPYASSLRGRKSKNIAVVIPEVADSFFSLAINGIESVAKAKGYHVLKEFQGGRVDGVLLSVSRETTQCSHISNLIENGVPVVFFDRACDDVETAKITTDDFESSYKATVHLIAQGCKRITFLSISDSLSISNKRLEGYLQALSDHKIKANAKRIIQCTNDAQDNYLSITKLLQQKQRPDGIVASVEKLTTPVYMACKALALEVPRDIKLVCFSNLETAAILNPSLTTITQPAFEMGKAAATILFKALGNPNFSIVKEDIIIPSTLVVRGSTSMT
jgi:LacI family transcriptional regulator